MFYFGTPGMKSGLVVCNGGSSVNIKIVFITRPNREDLSDSSLTPFSGRRTACGSTQKGVTRLEDEVTTVGIPKGRRQIELKSHANAGGRAKLSRIHPPWCRRPSKYIRDGSN